MSAGFGHQASGGLTVAEWTEAKILDLVATRYCGQEWAFIRKVPNGTGMAQSRTADAMAMGLWPSKGLYLHGHEIKCSRSDWLREIQDVSKAEAFAQFCHYWWIVAPKGAVELTELPANWGLLLASETGLRVKRPATCREPKPVDHAFLAGLLRAASRSGLEAELREAEKGAFDQGYEACRKSMQSGGNATADVSNRELERLKSQIDEFNEASGLEFPVWFGARELGRAVRLVKESRVSGLRVAAERAASEAKRLHEMAETVSNQLRQAESADVSRLQRESQELGNGSGT